MDVQELGVEERRVDILEMGRPGVCGEAPGQGGECGTCDESTLSPVPTLFSPQRPAFSSGTFASSQLKNLTAVGIGIPKFQSL